MPRAAGDGRLVEAWTTEEVSLFLDHVRSDRLYAVWHLALITGMRRGELLGLRWEDVDFETATLAVRQSLTLAFGKPVFSTPKNHQARVINLDDVTVAFLQEHRLKHASEIAEWGADYEQSGLAFRREDGRQIDPKALSKAFDRLVRQVPVRRITVHGLRHTAATLMLKEGIAPKVVTERMGHSDPAFTMRVYQHVLPSMQADAAQQYAALLNRQPPSSMTARRDPRRSDERSG